MKFENWDKFRDTLFENLKYKPTELEKIIHDSKARIKLVAGGERAGKSTVGAKEALPYALLPHTELIWIVGATYDIPRYTEFTYLYEDLAKLGFAREKDFHRPEQGPCTLTLDPEYGGCRIVTRSATDPEKLGMEAPGFILATEAAQLPYEVWLRLRGRIAEKRAPMVLTGTFEQIEDNRWYEEFYWLWQGPNEDEAQSFSLPSWSNTIKYPGGRQDPEIIKLEMTTPPDIFQERYGGVPCKPSGLVIKEVSPEIHVKNIDVNKDLPVYIAVDPGYAGAHVVEFIQDWGEQIAVLDEIYAANLTTDDMIVACKQKPCWSQVTDGAIDIASHQHQAMRAPIEVWQSEANLYLHANRIPEEDGIELLRTYLLPHPVTKIPKTIISPRCKGLLAECGVGGNPITGSGKWLRHKDTRRPIDKNNHACKAMVYFLYWKYGYGRNKGREDYYGRVMAPDDRREMQIVRR